MWQVFHEEKGLKVDFGKMPEIVPNRGGFVQLNLILKEIRLNFGIPMLLKTRNFFFKYNVFQFF